MTFRYLSVCSGIEACSVAWANLGWTAAGYSEIEPFPRAVLEQRFGAVPVNDDHRYSPLSNVLPLFGDFTKIEAHHVGPIDLLVGGTPCQSFSIAGKRLGLDDPRGNLTLEFLALARRVRPRWIVWENVPGILSDDGGKTMGTFLWLLGELGYRWAYRVLDAQFIGVDGFERAVPQRRRRVFVVGHLGDDARAATVLFERESLRGHPAPRREAGQGATHDVAPSLVSSGRGVERGGDTRGQDPVIACADVAPTLNAAFGNTQGIEDQHINGGGDCSFPRVSMCLNAGAMGRQDAETETLIPTIGGVFDEVLSFAIQERAVSENPDNGPQGSGIRTDGAAYTLEARHHVQAVAYGLSTQQEPKWAEDISPSLALPSKSGDGAVSSQLTTGGGKPGQGQPCIAESWAVRRLTPMECERLQGFPDGHTAIQWRGKDAADGPRYKAIGNSMACNVMRWIGERITYVEAATAGQV